MSLESVEKVFISRLWWICTDGIQSRGYGGSAETVFIAGLWWNSRDGIHSRGYGGSAEATFIAEVMVDPQRRYS